MAASYGIEAASPLLDLPVELVHSIMNVLSTEALSALRLTCSTLARLGTEHVLNEIHLVYRLDRLRRLDEISAHPVISKTVKSLYYQVDRLKAIRSFEDWDEERSVALPEKEQAVKREELYRRLDAASDSLDGSQDEILAYSHRIVKGNFTRAELEAAWNRYCVVYVEQLAINTHQTDVMHLTQMFLNCTNIERVDFSVSHGPRGGRSELKKFAFADCHMDPDGDVELTAEGNEQLIGLCKALHQAQKKLKYLSISELGYMIFQTAEDHDLEMMQEIVSDLHEFRLGFGILFESPGDEVEDGADETVDFARAVLSNGGLAALLSSAHALRVLKIAAPSVEPHLLTLSLAMSVHKKTWPKLREFGVSSMWCTEDELVNFLLRHKNTLRRISLSYMMLTQGTWQSVFDRIAGQLPKLRKLKLSGTFALAPDDDVPFIDLDNEPEFRFPTPGLGPPEYDIVHDGIIHYIKHGGNDRTHLLRAQQREEEEEDPQIGLAHPDYEYDSDGSYVSYGSDELDTVI